jgi:non-specific serine/threonine protein kinase
MQDQAPSLGERLRSWRLRAGLTQEALAERAGLGAAAVAALERGTRRSPYPHTLLALAGALGLSAAERAAFVEAAPPRTGAAARWAVAGPTQLPPSNMPAPRTPLIGRAEDRACLVELLTDHRTRLVTVTGVGGTGKTSLALWSAEDVRPHFADGAWLVELAPLLEPEVVARMVAAVLGVPEGRLGPLEALLAYLREKQLLLVLDNCEHLIEACGELAARVLAVAPAVRLLVTSREPLLLAGERQLRITPLAVPEADDFERLSPQDLAGYAAVQLFLERAQAVAPGLRLDPTTAPAIGLICNRLAGIPLALELAAARLRALTLAEVVERLDDTFQLLAGSSRMTPTRQQTLRASLDWSYALLPEAEQAVFRGLAAFTGGCQLEAAETVCVGSDAAAAVPSASMLDLMTGLVDKSLVVMEAKEAAAWYWLLEPVRQYAQDRLEASGEGAAVRKRHRAFYLELAERAARHLHGPAQVAWLTRLDRERDNLRAALSWAHAEPDADALLRLAIALVPFWDIRGQHIEGRRWLEQALQRGASAGANAKLRLSALLGSGRLALFQADLGAALSFFEQGHTVALQLDDGLGRAEALTWIGTTYRRQGEFDRAEHTLRHSQVLHEALGDESGAAWALFNLAVITVNRCDIKQRDWPQASPLCEAALARYRALGDVRQVGAAALTLGSVVARLGERERSVGLLGEGLAGLRAVGDRSYLLTVLVTVASVAAELGQPRRAARLLGAAEALGEVLGATDVAPVNRADEAQALHAMRGPLSETQLHAARTEGRALAPAAAELEAEAAVQLLARVRRSPPDPAPGLAGEVLTRREQDVVRLLAAGYTDRQIASALGITPGTAAVHVHHVLRKLGLRSRWQVGDRGAADESWPASAQSRPIQST